MNDTSKLIKMLNETAPILLMEGNHENFQIATVEYMHQEYPKFSQVFENINMFFSEKIFVITEPIREVLFYIENCDNSEDLYNHSVQLISDVMDLASDALSVKYTPMEARRILEYLAPVLTEEFNDTSRLLKNSIRLVLDT